MAKVKQNRKLNSLDPFVDEDQIPCLLCVGGRLKNRKLNNNCTYPILLSKDGTVTELLIRWYYEKKTQRGEGIPLSEIKDQSDVASWQYVYLIQTPRQGKSSSNVLDVEVYMADWDSRKGLANHARKQQKR